MSTSIVRFAMVQRRKVALLIETSNSYGRQLLQGVRDWVREDRTWSIRLSEHGRGAGVPVWLRHWQGDGIIARVENARVASALRAAQTPVVDVAAAMAKPLFPRVVTDSQAVTGLAAQHLRDRGFRYFGYCGDEQFYWSGQRGRYFAEHVHAMGGTISFFVQPATRMDLRYADRELKAIVRWLQGLPKPAGVLACYDVRGRQVLEACREANIKVPDEVAVIGVHNDDLLCELCDPPLSSVIPNARRSGYEAASLLARLMEGEQVPVDTRFVEPIGVEARQSTDVLAVADPKLAAAVRYIRDRAGARMTVAELLEAVPMSRTLLEQKFRQYLGRTPHDYIQSACHERVKALLTGTDLPIGAIAERTGFEHIEYLSVAFRRATGLSPSDYRRRHRTNGSF